MRFTSFAISAGMIAAAPAMAQHGNIPDQDPTRAKTADSRQYRGEPKAAEAKRGTRCKIVVQKGQDKHVCGVPTKMSPGDGRKK